MIRRFREVVPNKLYRGSAPSPQDVSDLKDKLGIKKIVSLDKLSGDRIDRVCKLLGIDHIKLYIDEKKSSLLHFLSQDLKELFLEDGPTFVHCHEGKDRTGLACALVKCKYFGMNPNKAIQEAKSLGFGIGVPPKVVNLYEKIIHSCKPSKDSNSSDSIVSNERDPNDDNRGGVLDQAHQGSFAPYLDQTRQYPADSVYNYINDQSPTRENYNNKALEDREHDCETATVPIVGEYDNGAGLYGAGPVFPAGGFIND